MILALDIQVKIIIFSLAAGILTGFLFSIYRIIRGFERIPVIIMIIEDVLFWVLSSIVIFIFLLYTDYAFVSAYVYLYIFMGICIYTTFLKKITTNVIVKCIKFIVRSLRIIKNNAYYIIKSVLYAINLKK